jgi:hypothetical protein
MNAWMRAGLVGLVLAAPGCSLGSLAYFLTPEQKLPPELCGLASPDRKQQVRVIILASAVDPIARQGCAGVPRDLSERLARQLHELCAANKENILIVAPRKIEEYKSKHSDWATTSPAEIGKEFNADYVINLEINSISMMEKGGFSDLYRGRVEMSITLVDVHHADHTPERAELTDVYPDESRPIPTTEYPIQRFRGDFLDRLAKRVAWHFAAHPRGQSHQQDPKARFGGEF